MILSDNVFKLNRDGGREKISRAMYSPKSFREPVITKEVGISFKAILIIGVIVAVVYGFITYVNKETKAPIPLPDNGSVIQYRPIDTSLAVAQFKVITDSTAVSTHYFVLINDWNTSAPVLAMFIAGGREAQTMLPIGTYRVSIAKGREWYGIEHMFGKNTIQSQGVNPITIRQYSQNQTMGVVINLNQTSDGNYPINPGSLRVNSNKEF